MFTSAPSTSSTSMFVFPAPSTKPTSARPISNPTIFCCDGAVPVGIDIPVKLHKDPNRELHEAIFQSFVGYAVKRQAEEDREFNIQSLLREVGAGADSSNPQAAETTFAETLQPPMYVEGKLVDNPLTDRIAYVIHLTSRHDFGPVYSHRYLICPTDLKERWIEVSQMEWFAEGKPFDLKAEQWDLKCAQHSKFFRMTLRPNLNLRNCPPVNIPLPSLPLVDSRGEQNPPPTSSNSDSGSPGLAPSLIAGAGRIQASPLRYGNLVAPKSDLQSPASTRSPTSLVGSAAPFQPADVRESGGYFDQGIEQLVGLQAGSLGGGYNAQGFGGQEYRNTDPSETGGHGGYLAHSHRFPSNSEADYFNGRYLVQAGAPEYGGLRASLACDSYPHPDFPEGGGCWLGSAADGYSHLVGADNVGGSSLEFATEQYARVSGEDVHVYDGFEKHW